MPYNTPTMEPRIQYATTKALECAIDMQRALAAWNQGVGAQGLAPLHMRIGLNPGHPLAEENDRLTSPH